MRESLVDLAVLKIEDMSALEFDLVAGISRYSRNWITSVTVKYFTHRHPKDVVALASSYTGQALIATSYYIHFYLYSSVPVLTRLESSIGRKCKKHFTSTLVTWRTIPYICISPQLTTEDITPCMHHIIYHLSHLTSGRLQTASAHPHPRDHPMQLPNSVPIRALSAQAGLHHHPRAVQKRKSLLIRGRCALSVLDPLCGRQLPSLRKVARNP